MPGKLFSSVYKLWQIGKYTDGYFRSIINYGYERWGNFTYLGIKSRRRTLESGNISPSVSHTLRIFSAGLRACFWSLA